MKLIGPEFIQVTSEKIKTIKDRMKAAHGRKNIYTDNRRRPLEFSIGDRVFLKVSPWKHMLSFFLFLANNFLHKERGRNC
jgi:hypothetical protein